MRAPSILFAIFPALVVAPTCTGEQTGRDAGREDAAAPVVAPPDDAGTAVDDGGQGPVGTVVEAGCYSEIAHTHICCDDENFAACWFQEPPIDVYQRWWEAQETSFVADHVSEGDLPFPHGTVWPAIGGTIRAEARALSTPSGVAVLRPRIFGQFGTVADSLYGIDVYRPGQPPRVIDVRADFLLSRLFRCGGEDLCAFLFGARDVFGFSLVTVDLGSDSAVLTPLTIDWPSGANVSDFISAAARQRDRSTVLRMDDGTIVVSYDNETYFLCSSGGSSADCIQVNWPSAGSVTVFGPHVAGDAQYIVEREFPAELARFGFSHELDNLVFIQPDWSSVQRRHARDDLVFVSGNHIAVYSPPAGEASSTASAVDRCGPSSLLLSKSSGHVFCRGADADVGVFEDASDLVRYLAAADSLFGHVELVRESVAITTEAAESGLVVIERQVFSAENDVTDDLDVVLATVPSGEGDGRVHFAMHGNYMLVTHSGLTQIVVVDRTLPVYSADPSDGSLDPGGSVFWH